MLFLHQIVLLASLLLPKVLALPQATPTAIAPPPGETFAVGFPICNVSGYTYESDSYQEYIYAYINSSLSVCIQACRANLTCDSIAWAPFYTECIFYNTCVEKTLLLPDPDSLFIHYDNICDTV